MAAASGAADSWENPHKIPPSALLLVLLTGFVQFHQIFGVEVNIGKVSTLTVLNGSDVMLPCTFSSCMSYSDSSFWWNFQKNKTAPVERIIFIKLTGKRPSVTTEIDRFMLIGDIKRKNISLLLEEVEFEDAGLYTCAFKNPNEADQQANSTLQLFVVSELLPVDNKLTVLIASIVGGVIGLLILLFIIKKLIMLIIKQIGKKKKECLVNSCANTQRGHYGSKADLKSPPKA
ncbi:sodium channel subunit beta-4 [Amblyraja radiata]|uniref:sodium channel subunit beta-4 n=1 Tax=Amblyraja radiata TaxID=386614 RepID=UPI001402BE32|nr:sodium channel subunit beta-4 [Amblyraja radiata]